MFSECVWILALWQGELALSIQNQFIYICPFQWKVPYPFWTLWPLWHFDFLSCLPYRDATWNFNRGKDQKTKQNWGSEGCWQHTLWQFYNTFAAKMQTYIDIYLTTTGRNFLLSSKGCTLLRVVPFSSTKNFQSVEHTSLGCGNVLYIGGRLHW